MKKFDIYEMVTNLIIERLEAVTKKPYRGFNFWYLMSFGFERPWFLTFNQIKELGGTVKTGAKSYLVVFWKMLEFDKKDGTTDDIPFLRYYRVFHVDSVEGIDESKIPSSEAFDHNFNPLVECERFVEFWVDSPKIELGHHSACYVPGLDVVRMPNPRTFFTDEGYFSVLYHELVHATGHRKRLNRHEKFPIHRFSSQDYSHEELVAEMGAAYLCGICGIGNTTIDQSAAYIKSWLQKFKNDNRMVVTAASYAQKAVDYILEHQSEPVNPAVIKPKEEVVTASFEF